MRKLFGLSTSLIALAVFAAACTPAAAPPAPAGEDKPVAPAAKEKPQYGGVYRTSGSNPRIGQDPVRTSGSSHFSNFGQAYDTLLRYKNSLDISESEHIIAPNLAERWENPTPTTWVFYLRKGVKWHNIPPVNGREFTADDVVYGINRLAGPGSVQRGYWLDLEKVEALDKYTVKFTLKNPAASFLTNVVQQYNKMTAKEAVEAGGGNVDNGPLIGTGPWFVTCTVDVECLFKRNPDYFLKDEDGSQIPYMDMQNIIMADLQARFASFRAKQLDAYSLTADELGIVGKAHPEVVYRRVKSFNAYLIHFRNDQLPWSDERVRTAVSKALDRQQILDTVLGGYAWFHFGWGAQGEDWYLPQDEFKQAYKRDVPLAKKLLAEAGYANGFDASLWCANYGVTDVPACELMQAQLAEVGIRIKIYLHDPPVYLSQVFIRDGKFPDLAWGTKATHPDPDLWLSDYYHSKGGRNTGYINDPKLDSMIETQRRELNPEKRKNMILEMQRYLLQKNYGLAMYSTLSANARWPWVKNVAYSASGNSRSIDYMWIDQALKKKLGGQD